MSGAPGSILAPSIIDVLLTFYSSLFSPLRELLVAGCRIVYARTIHLFLEFYAKNAKKTTVVMTSY